MSAALFEITFPFPAISIEDLPATFVKVVACISEIDTTCVAMFSVGAVYDRPFFGGI
jgi:hypothetical protein